MTANFNNLFGHSANMNIELQERLNDAKNELERLKNIKTSRPERSRGPSRNKKKNYARAIK